MPFFFSVIMTFTQIIVVTAPCFSGSKSPLVKAVNQASKAGVVVVASAGNYQPGPPFEDSYFKIKSPGCAEKAITVGNCDKNDCMAYDSGKGPTIGNYIIKFR